MTDPLVLIGFIFLAVYFIEWSKRYAAVNYLGSPVLAILCGAVLSNVGVIPHSAEESEFYGFVLSYVAPAAIFLLLLQVNLRKLVDAGRDMLIIFALSLTGVVVGALLFFPLVDGKMLFQPTDAVAAGILTAGHIGGSLNFNAVALHYDITKNANAFAALLTVDHIMIVFWMIVTVFIPRFQKSTPAGLSASEYIKQGEDTHRMESIEIKSFALLGGLVIIGLAFSQWISGILSDNSIDVPTILIISGIALVFAHLPLIRKVSGYDTVGELFIYLFLIVIGAHTDFSTLLHYGTVSLNMFMYISLIFLVHAAFVLLLGRIFVKDLGIVALGSQACIGGPVSAAALAKSVGREDLTLPSVLVGSLGGGIGTFIGFAIIYAL